MLTGDARAMARTWLVEHRARVSLAVALSALLAAPACRRMKSLRPA